MSSTFQSSTLSETPIVWKSADGREWKVHQMSTSHLINITRQMLNAIAVELGLEPIPIQTPVRTLNFHAFTWRLVMDYLKLFVGELVRRFDGDPEVSQGYLLIWRQMAELAGEIEKIRVENPDLFDARFDWDSPVWKGESRCQ